MVSREKANWPAQLFSASLDHRHLLQGLCITGWVNLLLVELIASVLCMPVGFTIGMAQEVVLPVS